MNLIKLYLSFVVGLVAVIAFLLSLSLVRGEGPGAWLLLIVFFWPVSAIIAWCAYRLGRSGARGLRASRA